MTTLPVTHPAPPPRAFRFPHPLVLLMGFVVLGAALSYLVPAGEFRRQLDPVTQREVVVPGSYHRVAAAPVSPLQMLTAVPRGMQAAGDIIFLIFLAGGAFTVVDQTGALRFGVDWLLRRLHRRRRLVVPVVVVLFATLGALENMGEEIIPLAPVLLLLMRRLGFPPLTAVAASVGSAFVGASFSPINPFQVGIAQQLAQLPLLSGGAYRMVFLLLAVGLWGAGVVRYAHRHEVPPADAADATAEAAAPVGGRPGLVLLAVGFTFGLMVWGILRQGWGFNELSAVLLALGLAAGLLGGLGATGTAEGFVTGFRDLAFSAMVIGFARAIFVVLQDGHIVDTLVNAVAAPLGWLPQGLAAGGMVAVHTLLHVPVPSGTGQASLTMPLLVPLSDLIGLSRQVTVLAFQYGAGLCELLTPTNGTLVAMLAATGVRLQAWWRFALPLYGLLLALGLLSVGLGIWLGV